MIQSSNPQPLTGGFTHEEYQVSRSSSIDWITFTGPEDVESEALTLFLSAFPAEDQGHAFSKYMKYVQDPQSGAYFAAQNVNGGNWQVTLPGKACSSMSLESLVLFWNGFEALTPTNVTRLDVAVDLLGCLDNFIGAFEHAAATRAIHPRLLHSRHQSNNGSDLAGDTLYLGSPKSSQYLRIYDKGLETGLKPAGEWIRWEAQFNRDRAPQAWKLVNTFRTIDGLCHLARGVLTDVRGPASPLADLISTAPIKVPPKPQSSDGQSFLAYFKNCIAPTIVGSAERLRMDPYKLARELQLFDGVDTTGKNSRREAKIRDIVVYYAETTDA